MSVSEYAGKELEVFAAATVWKAYFARLIRPYLGRRVLEVGAGIGGTTRSLVQPSCEEWWCLEPDAQLADTLQRAIGEGDLPACCRLSIGTVQDIPPAVHFDSVLYIDVLEHIADDREELARGADRLSPGGHLIVLAPAHPWLFTAFDKSIGHFRRYEKRTLVDRAPGSLTLVRFAYLDSVGMLASMANRFLLGSDRPRPGQIAFWDKVLVRLSRVLDPLTCYALGKSVLAVWRNTSGPSQPGAPIG